METNDLINLLTEEIGSAIENGLSEDSAILRYQGGVLLTVKQARQILNCLNGDTAKAIPVAELPQQVPNPEPPVVSLPHAPQSKTVLEWLHMLPEPYRSRAIANANENNAELKRFTLQYAIQTAFVWENSPEGHDYWSEVCDMAENAGFDTSNIPWPDKAAWGNAPEWVFARAVDSNGCCYFYGVFNVGNGYMADDLPCGKITDMTGIDWEKSLEFKPQ